MDESPHQNLLNRLMFHQRSTGAWFCRRSGTIIRQELLQKQKQIFSLILFLAEAQELLFLQEHLLEQNHALALLASKEALKPLIEELSQLLTANIWVMWFCYNRCSGFNRSFCMNRSFCIRQKLLLLILQELLILQKRQKAASVDLWYRDWWAFCWDIFVRTILVRRTPLKKDMFDMNVKNTRIP